MHGRTKSAMHQRPVSKMVMLGFMLVLILGCVRGQTDGTVSQKVDPSMNKKAYISLIPNSAQSQPEPNKRMDLWTYFLNSGSNNQQEAEPPAPRQVLVQDQQPGAQVQIQQPNPNQLIVTRENDFLGGSRRGLFSRLMMARRTARMRRLSNMFRILPSLLRAMGQIQIPVERSQDDQLPLLLNNRDGLVYNPADVMKRPPLYSSEKTTEQPKQQDQKKDEQQKQQTREYYHVKEDPRYDIQDIPTQQLKELQLGKYGSENQKFNDFDDQSANKYAGHTLTDYVREVDSNLRDVKDYSIKLDDIKSEKPYDIVLSGNFDGVNTQVEVGGSGLTSSGADFHHGSIPYRPPIIPSILHTAGLSNNHILGNFPVHKPPVISIPKPVFKPPPKPIVKPPPKPIAHPPPKPILKPLPGKLLPLGILPKPLLNINGKLFFGAELGKNAGIGAGR